MMNKIMTRGASHLILLATKERVVAVTPIAAPVAAKTGTSMGPAFLTILLTELATSPTA